MPIPQRTADTMSEAISMSSPSGHTSKRAQEAAAARLSEALFGPGGLQRPTCPQPTERERLLRQAEELRDKRHISGDKPVLAYFNVSAFVIEYRDILSGDRTVYVVPFAESR